MVAETTEVTEKPKPPRSAKAGEAKPPPTPMAMCPMAETCKGIMDKPLSRGLMLLPGLGFIALGVLIVLVPAVLPWLVAIAAIAMGVMMLMMARFVRGIGARFQGMR